MIFDNTNLSPELQELLIKKLKDEFKKDTTILAPKKGNQKKKTK